MAYVWTKMNLVLALKMRDYRGRKCPKVKAQPYKSC